MCKSLLYAVNTLTQAIPATGTEINLGTATRSAGCNLSAAGGQIVVKGIGYYDIDSNFTFAATGTGTATLTLLKDGISIAGATQSITIATAGDNVSFNIPAIIKQTCCKESVITAFITGVAGNITNAAIMAEKM